VEDSLQIIIVFYLTNRLGYDTLARILRNLL